MVPHCSLRRRSPRAFHWFFTWLATCALALAAEVIQLNDGGKTRPFEIAEDEVFVSRWGAQRGELARELPTAIPGAKVLRDFGKRVIVKLPAPVDRSKAVRGRDPVLAAVPTADWQPIVYLSGVARSEATTRTITRELLVELRPGETGEQLRKQSGAERVRATSGAGRVVLTFPNAFAAIDAVKRIRAGGSKADPVLGRILERFAVPNDPFFANQWHLRNIGQGGGSPGVDANIVNAWDITRGTGVNIVINDDSMQTQPTSTPSGGHPDLRTNTRPVDSGLHYDFRDQDTDPNPEDIYDAHGTAVSGVAAARGNNAIGVSGGAPEANLVGLRTIGSFVTDLDIATSVSWSPTGYAAAVSNNSWGYTGAPGLRDIDIDIKNALRDAALTGRGGLGQVTLFANGNSQQSNDDGNYTTLANSRYVVAVGAIDNFGRQSYYSNPGANLLISAPSNGGSLGIFTTDVTSGLGYNPQYNQPGEPADTNYTANFGGTSSATPLTTGCVALILAAKPTLGWRDVHEILAQTARKIDASDTDWVQNGAGFHFNHKYGAGMVDATAGVVLALDWNNLGTETSVTRSLSGVQVPAVVPDNNATGISRDFDLTGSANVRVERVEVVARITTGHRSDLEVSLVSPDGTKSILAPKHPRPSFSATGDDDVDYDGTDGVGWTFTSTHHWGENSQGTWSLKVRDLTSGTIATLRSARLTVYGTASPLQRVRFAEQRVSALENAGSTTVRVERLGGTSGTITVDYLASSATTAASAVEGIDFGLTPGTLTFADGESFKDIPITLTDNPLEQGNRFAYLVLKNPSGASLGGPALARLDIIDDESNLVTVAPGDFDVSESSSLQNPGTFIISRSKPTAQPLTVTFTLGGTALEGTDYTMVTHSVIIPANQASATVTISPADDGTLEGTESVVLTLDSGIDYGLGVPASAQLNVVDNDQPQITIVAVDNSATETGSTTGTIRVTRLDPASGLALNLPTAQVVNLSIGGTATPGINYVPIESFIVIPANADHADITVTPLDDDKYKPNASVVVSLVRNTEYAFGFKTEDVVTIVDNELAPDPRSPVVKLVAPKANEEFDAGATISASGTATDNEQVLRVLVAVNEGAFQPATGTATWSLDISSQIVPGINRLRVKALDNFDNESAVVERTFSYIQTRTLTVAMVGSGAVSRGYAPSSQRNAGFPYTITASPSAGFIFAGWSGAAASNDSKLTFTMPDSDTTLTARFIANPFSDAIAGNYQGLVRNAATFGFETSGFLQVKVATTGMFTGSLTLGGVKFPLKGRFTGDQPTAGVARYLGTIKRKTPLAPLQVDLRIDTAGGTGQITGTAGTLDAQGAVLADRAFFDKNKNPYVPGASTPQLFNIHFPPPASPTLIQPRGDGFATLSIDASGTVKLNGQLPDGTKVSQKTALSKDLVWPFFVSLYSKTGVALGRVTLDSAPPTSDLAGVVDWLKQARAKDKFFPDGFVLPQMPLTGEVYVAPDSDHRVLANLDTAAGNAGTAQFREGNLLVGALNRQFDAPISLVVPAKVVVGGANTERLALTFKPKNGTFGGSFVHPVTGQKTAVVGVFLQKTQRGVGSFPGSLKSGTGLQTGRITILPGGM